jgi:sugar phosphate isomerase/epimerase
VLLGTGIVPFDLLFFFLKRSGYEGWISIEEASGLGERGIEEAVGFVRSTWKAC